MEILYTCKNEQRKNLIAEPKDSSGNPLTPQINGIDFLEIATLDQKTINIHFIHNLPGQSNPVPPAGEELATDNFIITGGERIKNIKVTQIKSVQNNLIKITVNQSGDFSSYTLSIIASPGLKDPPPGFDAQLSSIDFSFKVNCPNDFDCKIETECPPEKYIQPEIDYLTKDYNSFRRLILDRLSALIPEWQERNTADVGIMLAELMAYIGDQLSYYQDAVANEAYLGTARKRISLRKHARLLDYRINDGCNSRVWIHIEAAENGDADGKTLQKGTLIITGGESSKPVVKDLNKILPETPVLFETMHNIILNSAHNKISFYTWGDSECCLTEGSTSAVLLNKDKKLNLKPGDVLILEETLSPATGLASDADLQRRHPIRLSSINYTTDPLLNKDIVQIEWYKEDALPFPLTLSANVKQHDVEIQLKEISFAYGNIVLADYGFTMESKALIPDTADGNDFRPALADKNITFSEFYDDNKLRKYGAGKAIKQNINNVLPQIKLFYKEGIWIPRLDLLASGRFAAEFICETENDGSVYLRFGDDVLGKEPSAGTKFTPVYRTGNGKFGNVGAESIRRIFTDYNDIKHIRNPLPAYGGTDPESNETIRQLAPQAFRKQERAVTEPDYSEVTERHDDVQRAAANFRWTGSWNTVFVTVDRAGGIEADQNFREEISNHLEKYRMAGYDLEVNTPQFIPLEIEFDVCVKPGYFRADVKEQLTKAFSRRQLSGGKRGFFHPDNFTFGQPVYLSHLYKTAMEIDGVSSIVITKFHRFGKKASGEIDAGLIQPSILEIIRLDNNPNFPEHGKINFILSGGL